MPDSPGTDGPSMPVRVGFWILMALSFGLCVASVFLGPLNHDVAWYLLVAGRVVDGERLYVDVFDTNPPLIVWLSLVPVLLSRVSGISEILALRVLTFSLIAGSLGLTGWALDRALPGRWWTRWALLWLSLFVLVPVAGYESAQREHLLMILALPYLVTASARADGRSSSGPIPWVVGLMAGLGLAIKPHFLLLWLTVEATLIVRRGWRISVRPEGLAIVAVGLAYAVALLAFAPGYLPWVRRITSVYYGSGGAPWGELARQTGTILTVLALLVYLSLKPEGEARSDFPVILTANLALLTIAVIQVKGYNYQFYPAKALAILVLGWLVAGVPGVPSRNPRVLLMVRAVLVILVLGISMQRVRESLAWRGDPGGSDTTFGRLIRAANQHAGGGSVFVFSPAVATGFPMVNYSGVGWASSHPALLFLPGCYPRNLGEGPAIAYHPPDRMGDAERFLFNGVVERLLRDRPALLFVDEDGTPLAFEGRPFDYLAYYSQDPRFAGFFRDYEPLPDRLDQFRLYRRKAAIRH